MVWLLVPGVLSALLGIALASSATLGVAFIGLACFLAILARIWQADTHHHRQ